MSGFQTIEELQTEVDNENIDYSEEDLSLKFSSLFAHPDFVAHVKHSKIVDNNIDTLDSCVEIHTHGYMYILEEENNLLSSLLKDSPCTLELFTNPLDNLTIYIHDMLVFLHYDQDIVKYNNDKEKSVVGSEILLEPLSEKRIKTMEELLQNISHWWI